MRLFAFAIVLILLPSLASADPASLLLVSLKAAGVLVTQFGAALIRIGVGVALSALSVALKSKSSATGGGIRTTSATAGDATPQSFILGLYATEGNLVAPEMSHAASGSDDRKYLTRVVDLGDIPIDGLDHLIVDGKVCHLATGTPSTLPVSDGDLGGSTAAIHPDYGPTTTRERLTGFLWCQFYDGTQIVADPMLLDRYGAYPERPWSADMVGTGISYAVLTFRSRQTPAIWQGPPRVRFVVRGVKLYDPRLDTSAGGSGSHRYGNSATYAFTRNPMVMIYNIARGIVLPDGSVFGGGFDATGLPFTAWSTAMDDCDAVVEGQPQYVAGYEVRIATPDQGGDTPLDVIDELLKSCSAELVDMGGVLIPRVGGPGLAVRDITDLDIYRTRDQDLDPFPAMEDRHNVVAATYPSPDALWEAKQSPVRKDVAAITEDGRELHASLDLPAVPNAVQVQRLTKAWLADARRFRRHNIVVPPEGLLLQPFDAIDWTSARNGYADKAFEISEWGVDPESLAVRFAIREREAADYVWSPSDELPDSVGSVEPVIPDPLSVPGWAVAAQEVTDATGTARRAAIKLSWTDDTAGAAAVKWQVRLTATAAVVVEGSTDITLGQRVVSEGIVPATAYQARARLVSPQSTEWTAWTGVTSPAVYLSDADLDGALADLEAAAASANAAAQQAIDDIAIVREDLVLAMPREVQNDEAIAALEDQVTLLTALLGGTTQNLAEAGLYIDPVTGRASLEASNRIGEITTSLSVTLDAQAAEISLRATQAYVDQVVSDAMLDPSSIPVVDDMQIQITDLEVALNAAEAEISLRATITVVDGLDVRLSTAEVEIGDQAITLASLTTEFTDLDTRTTAAEIAITTLGGAGVSFLLQDSFATAASLEAAEIADLEDLVRAYENRQTAIADIAYLRQDMSARVAEGEAATAALRTELGVAFGNALAQVRQEVTVLASADEAIAQDVTQLDARLEDAETAQTAQSTAISQLTVTAVSQGLTLISQAADITQLESDVAGKASASAVTALTTRVDDAEDGITALSASQLLLTANTDSRVFVRRFVFDGTLGGLTLVPGTASVVYATTASATPVDKRTLQVTIGSDGYADLTYTLPEAKGWAGRTIKISGRSTQLVGGGVTVRGKIRRQVSLTDATAYDVTLGSAVTAPSSYGAWSVEVAVPSSGAQPVKDVILRLEGAVSHSLGITDVLFEDSTDVVALNASVTALSVATSDQFTAQASQITTLTADVGGIDATVTTQGAAIADLEGNASASLVFRVDAGDPASLELVSASTPGGAATSGVRIKGENILLDGDVEVDGSFTVTGPMIVNGAVSNVLFAAATATVDVSSGPSSPHVISPNLGAYAPVAYGSGGGPVIVTIYVDALAMGFSEWGGVFVIQGKRSDTLAWQDALGNDIYLPAEMNAARIPFTQMLVDHAEEIRNPGAYTYTDFRLAAYRTVGAASFLRILAYSVEIRQINK